MKEILPVLLILVCPVMMLVMMRGMHGGSHGASRGHDHALPAQGHDERDVLEERVQDLETRLAELEEEQYAASGQTVTRA